MRERAFEGRVLWRGRFSSDLGRPALPGVGPRLMRFCCGLSFLCTLRDGGEKRRELKRKKNEEEMGKRGELGMEGGVHEEVGYNRLLLLVLCNVLRVQ